MRLAEALQERADLNHTIEQLRYRLENNMLVQEGEITAEDPEELRKVLEYALNRLSYLMAHINLTNAVVQIDGQTLTELIAKKDMLTLKIRIYQEMVNTAGRAAYRARGTEIKVKPTIGITAWQMKINSMSRELRILDNQLQETNWHTDLIE